MKPEYFTDKGMMIDGNYWLVHPQTGKAWTKTAATKFINAWQAPDTSPDLEALKQAAVRTIKQQAGERISAMNWQLQRAEDRVSLAALGGAEQTSELEQAEGVLLEVLNAREAVRQASDKAEADVEALTDAEAIEQFSW